ncbi:hypothetical protein MVQ25_11225 [Fusobacterium necrophorum]|uniref:hypothetical protein n=1 Tax=Fusobacterium necrophorum TaxID=859 RepID=UPI00254EEB01|nr:hypothetical protein [Fusobacterium necrophorum]MDK4498551.1 hypothetical protein [Fusobacterium necrophorum]
MKKLMEVVKEIKGIEAAVEEFENEVVIAFGDYEFNGISEVILEKAIGQNYDYTAYANEKNAPEVFISVEKTEDGVIVLDAWTNEKEENFEKMIGKTWAEVKEDMIDSITVEMENVDVKSGSCIVDFTNCSFLSIMGTYREENDEVIIEVADNAIIYDNRG